MNHLDKLKENETTILNLIYFRRISRAQKIEDEINRLVRENNRIKQMQLSDALTRPLKTIEIQSKINRS